VPLPKRLIRNPNREEHDKIVIIGAGSLVFASRLTTDISVYPHWPQATSSTWTSTQMR